MTIWTGICLVLAVVFVICSIIFALLKEKGAILISGFNTLSKEEREKYDKKKMSIDMRNSFFIWSIILSMGVILSYFVSDYFGIVALIIWLILFLKEVHLTAEKAFGKYKKQ